MDRLKLGLLDAVEGFFKLGDERCLTRLETVAAHDAPEIIVVLISQEACCSGPLRAFLGAPRHQRPHAH